jgi:hypothetical protein
MEGGVTPAHGNGKSEISGIGKKRSMSEASDLHGGKSL